jgi:hypothetical protein
MSKSKKGGHEGMTYLVYGSGLMPVPYHSLNEVQRLKSEFHLSEAKQAMLLALTRKLA